MPEPATLDDLLASIVAAWPDLAGLPARLLNQGWDCLAVDLGGRIIVKVPRHEAARRRLETEVRLLAAVRPAVAMRLPGMTLHAGPPLMTRHSKIPGDHLLSADYARLSEDRRDTLAASMARFFVEIHALPHATMAAAGAGPVGTWLAPDAILDAALPVLPEPLRDYARRIVAAWRDLPPDPHGTVWGLFDGHGWNMAFDHESGRLNGLYDFGDSGFGPLHREFVYPNFIAFDLTARIAACYEAITGRAVDLARVDLLTAVLRLSELAELADDPRHRPLMLSSVADWAATGRGLPARGARTPLLPAPRP